MLTAIAQDKPLFLCAVEPADEKATVFDIAVAVVDIVEPVTGLDTVDVGIGAALGSAVNNLPFRGRVSCTYKGGIEIIPARSAYDVTTLYHVVCRLEDGAGGRGSLSFCLTDQRGIITVGAGKQHSAHQQEAQQDDAYRHGSALGQRRACTQYVALSDDVPDQFGVGFLAQAIDKDTQSLIGHIVIFPEE